MAAKFSEDVRPMADLKTRAGAVVDQACRTKRPVLLTRRGRGVAVLLDLEEYERLAERDAFVSAVEEGARAAAGGDTVSHETAVAVLESFGSEDD